MYTKTPPFTAVSEMLYAKTRHFMFKMKQKTKSRIEKKNLINIFLAILVGLGIYYLFKFSKASAETWFLLAVILLLLIYFELSDKNKK